jgi:excinuclease UvrABC nuclease subunit
LSKRGWQRLGGIAEIVFWPRRTSQGAGCYAFFMNDRLVYVGSSQNLQRRLMDYLIAPSYSSGISTPWGFCDRVEVRWKESRRYGDWLMWEARLIKRLRPPMNTLGNGRRWDRKMVDWREDLSS